MSDLIRFEIPGEVRAEDYPDYLREHFEEYSAALDDSADPHDDRAQVDEVRVTNVELTEDTVYISYEVDYSAHYGCRDMNYSETAERELVGDRTGRVFTFARFTQPEPRSTFEEL
jgi:hypothetical protein